MMGMVSRVSRLDHRVCAESPGVRIAPHTLLSPSPSSGKVDCDDRNCKNDPACLNLQPLCRRNKGCAALGLNAGSCCPTPSKQYLACCAVGSTKSEKGLCSDGVDNDGDGKIDCSDSECKTEDVCIFKGLNPMCSRNKNCTGLAGLCCPTVDGVYLDCCRGSLKST
jgi:hypothetical protein